MGFFTFTDASRPETKIKYGKRMVYVNPDNTHIVQENYDGYGRIGDRDVFVMLFEQNMAQAEAVINILSNSEKTGLEKELISTIRMYNTNPYSTELRDLLKKLQQEHNYEKDFINTGWKRHVGISMMQENEKLPFPMKVTALVRHKPYAELLPSVSTQ